MQPKNRGLHRLALTLLCMQQAAPLSTPTTTTEQLRAAHRSERLNLLNHPLQIQLATGALPYGSFVRLCHDRSTILDAVRSAAAAAGAFPRAFYLALAAGVAAPAARAAAAEAAAAPPPPQPAAGATAGPASSQKPIISAVSSS